MVSGPESVAAAAPGGSTDAALPPGARAILRWLPTEEPSGAFAGQHDQVHCPSEDLHARVSLWWSDSVVHPGDRVGPPRGGLAPGSESTYSVALPVGGYLWIDAGVLAGWRARSVPNYPLVRADGQMFEPGRYSSMQPYFKRHYTRMTESAVRASLASMGHQPASPSALARVLETISTSNDPIVCGCTGRQPTAPLGPLGLVVPESLLVDSGTLRVLVGMADPAESAVTLWRLTGQIWDPVRVGRALAAETVARHSGESARAWPHAPVTEQAVAHIAAQAIRYHGAAVVAAMPAWLLGWVMVAKPVLAAVNANGRTVSAALDAADRVRVARVETQWHAMAAARLLLSRTSAELRQLDDPRAFDRVRDSEDSLDLRNPTLRIQPDETDEPIMGMSVRDAIQRAYQCDARSWFGVIAEHL